MKFNIDDKILLNWQQIPDPFKLSDLVHCFGPDDTPLLSYLHRQVQTLLKNNFIKPFIKGKTGMGPTYVSNENTLLKRRCRTDERSTKYSKIIKLPLEEAIIGNYFVNLEK